MATQQMERDAGKAQGSDSSIGTCSAARQRVQIRAAGDGFTAFITHLCFKLRPKRGCCGVAACLRRAVAVLSHNVVNCREPPVPPLACQASLFLQLCQRGLIRLRINCQMAVVGFFQTHFGRLISNFVKRSCAEKHFDLV